MRREGGGKTGREEEDEEGVTCACLVVFAGWPGLPRSLFYSSMVYSWHGGHAWHGLRTGCQIHARST